MKNKEQLPIVLDKLPIPLDDRLLVKVIKELPKTTLILPSNITSKNYSFGVIEKIGNKVVDLEVGNKIIYSNYGGNPISFKEEDYLIMRMNDVFAIITESK